MPRAIWSLLARLVTASGGMEDRIAKALITLTLPSSCDVRL